MFQMFRIVEARFKKVIAVCKNAAKAGRDHVIIDLGDGFDKGYYKTVTKGQDFKEEFSQLDIILHFDFVPYLCKQADIRTGTPAGQEIPKHARLRELEAALSEASVKAEAGDELAAVDHMYLWKVVGALRSHPSYQQKL
jgi:hypothetical protein